jgi:uncharacterized membrane protein
MRFIKLFLIAFPIFFLLDMIWLGVLMRDFYSSHLSQFVAKIGGEAKVNWYSAIITYILLVSGLVYFVLIGFDSKPIGVEVFIVGAFFGLIVYGVYEFTNHATLAEWPLHLAIVDTAWGMALYGTTSYIAAWVGRYLSIM